MSDLLNRLVPGVPEPDNFAPNVGLQDGNSTGTGNHNNGLENDPGLDASDLSSLERRTLDPERFLYTELVKLHLGERAAAIIDLLASLGRLSVREMRIRLPDLDTKSIKSTLVSLIQLRCVQYFEETSLDNRRTTYYSFNMDGIIIFLYSGYIQQDIQESINASTETERDLLRQIVKTVLNVGSITLEDYLSSVDENVKHTVTDLFVRACEVGYLVPMTKFHYTPKSELWTLLYDKKYRELPTNSTVSDLKKRSEAKTKAKEDFAQLFDAVKDSKRMLKIDPETSLKTVIPQIPFTLDIDRFLKSRRSKQLFKYARSMLGQATAKIYFHILKHTEKNSPYLKHPLSETGLLQDLDEAQAIQEESELLEESPTVTFGALDVANYLPADIEVPPTPSPNSKWKARRGSGEIQRPKKKLKTEDGFVIPELPQNIKEEESENLNLSKITNDTNKDNDMEHGDRNDDEEDKIFLITNHLRVLANSSVPFLMETKPGIFYVPYSRLIPLMKASEFDHIVKSSLGPSALRIRRCIQANRLVSEKILNSTALIKEKDIRSTIASLLKHNMVEIQEVPRTIDRSASRAVFLFRVNDNHSYGFLRQNISWNIANLIHKKEILKSENSTLLSKAKRDDVKGNEQELLLPGELNQLKMVNECELNAYCRVHRLLSLWEVFKLF